MCSFIAFVSRTECQASRIRTSLFLTAFSTSLSPTSQLGQPQTYLKNQKTRSRTRLPEIKCKDCDCVYIGQTSRALKTRVKEHAKAIAALDEKSLLAKHHMRHSHQIDLASVQIVDRSPAWRQRLILEAWHSVRDTNAINEHIALPNVYNSITNL